MHIRRDHIVDILQQSLILPRDMNTTLDYLDNDCIINNKAMTAHC